MGHERQAKQFKHFMFHFLTDLVVQRQRAKGSTAIVQGVAACSSLGVACHYYR